MQEPGALRPAGHPRSVRPAPLLSKRDGRHHSAGGRVAEQHVARILGLGKFNFNNDEDRWNLGQPVQQPYKQGTVGLQGLTNYGVGRSNANGVSGFVFSGGSDTFNVLIRAAKTQGRVDDITRPNLTILDNQIGTVNVGGLYPYTNGGQFHLASVHSSRPSPSSRSARR